MVEHAHVAQMHVGCVGNLDGNLALLRRDVANREVGVSLAGVGGTQRVFAAHGINVFDHDVSIDLVRLVMVLHVNCVNSVLGVNLSHGDVVCTITDLDGSAV